MPDVKIPYPEVGLAAFEKLDTYHADLLISGSHPPLAPGYPMTVTASQALQQFHVVGLVDGKLVPAVWSATPADAVQAVGIVTQAVVGNDEGTTTVPVFYSGCFNPSMLVWDESFDTPEKKANAFNGAPTPTQILIRARG